MVCVWCGVVWCCKDLTGSEAHTVSTGVVPRVFVDNPHCRFLLYRSSHGPRACFCNLNLPSNGNRLVSSKRRTTPDGKHVRDNPRNWRLFCIACVNRLRPTTTFTTYTSHATFAAPSFACGHSLHACSMGADRGLAARKRVLCGAFNMQLFLLLLSTSSLLMLVR